MAASERDVGLEILERPRQLKRGEHGRVMTVPSVAVIREQTGLSQPKFARLLGVSVRTLQEWEQGRRAPYSHAILTGSEASILADTEWIVRTCDLTRALDARGVKLLGSCFGHQMLGRALSGPGGRRVTTPGGPRALRRRPR
jgi:putative transcriptional regulator